MSNLDFSSLLNNNRRKADNFVDATAWCKAFGKRWNDFAVLPETKRFINACCERKKTRKSGLVRPVKGVGTWVHPLIAIKLAEWLSPEFEVFAKEVLQKFIEAPEELAANILINSHNKDRVDRAKKRVLVSTTNKETMELAKLDGARYADVHNDRYRGLYQKTASQLREDLGLKKQETPLDKMSAYDLNLNSLANQMALMAGSSAKLLPAAMGLRQLHKQTVGKDLEVTQEDLHMRPSQARAIAYAPEYQTELPI